MTDVKPRHSYDVFAIVKLSADNLTSLISGVNCSRVQFTPIEGYDRHTHPHFYGVRFSDATNLAKPIGGHFA